jgi:hypothetical protein
MYAGMAQPTMTETRIAVHNGGISDEERSYCTSVNYHSLQKALIRLRYWPPSPALNMTVRESAADVGCQLSRNLKNLHHRYVGEHDGDPHRVCDASEVMAERVDMITRAVQDPVDGETLDAMRANGQDLMPGLVQGYPID